jgi:NADPH2:quinone reductase
MTRLIRALRLVAHGASLRIEQVPLREPGPGEVVVELRAAGVNPVDGYAANGLVAPDAPLPRTLGAEAAGWLDGAPVLVYGGALGMAIDGVWAEAVTVARTNVTPLAPAVDLLAAAGLGVVGTTAWNTVVHLAKVTADDRVLVLGAGGGVGLAVISLALSAGATVLGQVGNESKASAVRAFGARAVVADAAGLAAAVPDFAPSVVFDPLGGEFTPSALSLLAPRGRHVIYGTSAGQHAQIALRSLYRGGQRILGYGGLGLTDEERHAGAEAAAAAFADGTLRIHVGRVIALSEAASVLDALSDRTRAGKLVIDCTR